MNNGLLYLGGLLVLVFSALFAVPNFVDWNGYRGVFEEEASKVLGRDVRVGGKVNLKLLPVPYVRFEKVRIANVSGATGEPFVRADSFTMWLSGPALLRGVLEASEVQLDRPELTLAIDDKGGGNWSNIQFRAGDMPFVPRDVMLKSVKLLDGVLSIYNSENSRIAQLGAINGELSGDGLRGPFRFKGTAEWSGAMHDVSFATTSPDAEGAFGIKASARVGGSPNSYLLDGRVAGLNSKPTFSGDLTATVPVPGIEPAAHSGGDGVPVLDFKSQVTADPLSARFENVSLTLDNAAEPQSITGSATAIWNGAPRIDVVLASKWLDIDRLADAGKSGASFARLKRLAMGLLAAVAGDGAASAKINLEQVKLGGETAGGLYIDAARSEGKTHFNRLSASLPGNTRLEFAGDLKDAPGKFSFGGNASVSGANLARLKSWAERSGLALDIAADGAFSADGRIDVGEKQVAITDASLTLSGQDISGDLVINSDTHRMDLRIAAGRLDTRTILPKAARAVRAKLRAALGLPVKEAVNAADDPLGDARLRLLAGELTDNGETYRNVDLQFEAEGPELRLAASKLTTAAGLEVGLEGRVKTSETGEPKGTFSFDVSGNSADAARDLAARFGIAAEVGDAHLTGVRDAKLAGLLRLGARAPASADIAFDGTLGGVPFKGSGEFDGGLSNWRAAPVRFDATVDAPSLAQLQGLIGRSSTAGLPNDAPARADLLASGIPASGLTTRVHVSASGLATAFSGSVAMPDKQPWAIAGDVTVKSADANAALVLAGLPLPAGAARGELDGAIAVARQGGVWSLSSDRLAIGGSKLGGKLTVASAADGKSSIKGSIKVDRLVVPTMLAALADAPRQAAASVSDASASVPVAAPEANLWSDGLFDLASYRDLGVDVKIQFQSLVLSGKLATSDGALQLTLSPQSVDAGNIMANAAGGLLTGSFSLKKESDGVALATNLKLEDADLKSLSASASGKATSTMTATSRAQSPAGLFAVLTGEGGVEVRRDAAIPGPDPESVSKVADTVLRAKLQNDVRAIVPALTAALGSGRLPLGDRHIAVKIVDGTAKFETVERQTKTSSVSATLNLDLSSLRLNASSQIAASVPPLPPPPIPLPDYTPPAPKGMLPAVVVLYSGRADDLAAIASNVDAGEMQRELAVRQMERNVQQLDQTRRLDQERRRLLEEQRQKAIAAERAKREAAKAGVELPVEKAPDPLGATEPEPQQMPAASSDGNADGTAAPEATSEVLPPVQQVEPTEAPPSKNTLLTPKITIEPIGPEGQEQGSGEATTSAAGADATAAAAPKPVAAPRPRPRPVQRERTSSDEIRKSLGAFP